MLDLVDAASVDDARAQDAVCGIDQNHPQLLLLQRRHLDTEQVSHTLRRADWWPLLERERGEETDLVEIGALRRKSPRSPPWRKLRLRDISDDYSPDPGSQVQVLTNRSCCGSPPRT